jgi:hypothetical protein
VDNLLVKVGFEKTLFFQVVCFKSYSQFLHREEVVWMKGNTALNCAFLSFPQLNRLVTTTNFIDKKSHLKEQILIRSFKSNQLSKVKTKELG